MSPERIAPSPMSLAVLTAIPPSPILATALDAETGLQALLDQPALTAGDHRYDWRHVVLAAALRGEWRAVEDAARAGLACDREAAQSTAAVLQPGAVDAALRSFRYAHGLVSAQQAHDWLARWQLGVDAWTAHFRRALLREAFARELTAVAGRHDAAVRADRRALAAAVHADALCSGALGRFAHGLAGRAATRARLESEGAPPAAAPDPAPVPARLHEMPAVLQGADDARLRAALDDVVAAEAAYERFAHEALTERAIEAQLAAHHLDWIAVSCRSLAFAGARAEDAAREAALCLREDGLDMVAVAAESRGALGGGDFYLDQVEPALRDRLLGARAGELLGPVSIGGEWHLYELREKRLPTGRDPAVRRRAREAALRSAVEREIVSRVRWA